LFLFAFVVTGISPEHRLSSATFRLVSFSDPYDDGVQGLGFGIVIQPIGQNDHAVAHLAEAGAGPLSITVPDPEGAAMV